MLPLPQGYLGSSCEIKSLTNNFLGTGYLIKIDDDALEVAAHGGERMPLLQYRSVVKVVVFNTGLGTIALAGIVFLSTENFMRLDEVKKLNDFERRNAFRVSMDRPGKLFPVLSDEETEALDRQIYSLPPDEAADLMNSIAIDVRVLDLSLTGVRIQPSRLLAESSRYSLEFTPLDTPMRFSLSICRRFLNHWNETQYGCHFYGQRQRQQDRLCKNLFQLQREERYRQNASTL